MKEEPETRQDLKDRTRDFALRIVRLYSALPKATEAQVLGKQLLRSGTSVGAHWREGSRARSNMEFVSKVEGGIVNADRMKELTDEADELMAILTSCVKKVKSRIKRKDALGG